MNSDDLTEWCAGMPLVQRRPLEEAERRALARERRRLFARGLGVVLLYPLLVGLSLLAAGWARGASAAVQQLLAGGTGLLLMIGLPVLLLLVRDAFRRRGAIGRDLRSGLVKRFARSGTAGEESPPLLDGTLRQLGKARLLPADASAGWWIELLAGSGRVWRVMGQPVRRWIVAPTTEVASSPPGAAIAAQWLEPIAHNDAATLLRGQRELSTAEREELRRFARRLWRRPLPFAIGFTLYFFVPLATLLQEGLRESRADGFLFLLMAWVTLRIDTAFARALWHARRLEQDAREGRIVILRTDPITPPVTDEAPPPESASPTPDALIEAGSPLPEGDGSSRSEEAAAAGSEGPAAEDAVPLEPPAEAPVVELLPRSRWYWTIDGRPAPWRIVRP